MPFTPSLDPGEEILFEEILSLGGPSRRVAFALSTRSAFLPARKLFAVSDADYYRKLPLSDLRRISLARHRSRWLWIVSIFVLLFSAWALYDSLFSAWALYDSLTRTPRRLDFFAMDTVFGSVVVLSLALGRRSVVIDTVQGTYAWNPPWRLKRKAKQALEAFEQRVVQAFERAGVPVSGEDRPRHP